VVNGHKSAAHTDSPDGSTCNTCLGALAEVCTVPVLLVCTSFDIHQHSSSDYTKCSLLIYVYIVISVSLALWLNFMTFRETRKNN